MKKSMLSIPLSEELAGELKAAAEKESAGVRSGRPEDALYWAKDNLEPKQLEPALITTATVLRASEELLWRLGSHLQDALDFETASPAWGISKMIGLEAATIERLRDAATLVKQAAESNKPEVHQKPAQHSQAR